jgi:hypothetical protein
MARRQRRAFFADGCAAEHSEKFYRTNIAGTLSFISVVHARISQSTKRISLICP